MDKSSINKVLKKLRDTGTVNRLADSCRPWSDALNEMVNWLTIRFWVKKTQHRLTELSVKSHARHTLGWDAMILPSWVW